MSERIDAEMQRLKTLGQTPKTIRVGSDLYWEIYRELNPVIAADVLIGSDKAIAHKSKEVTDYKGIKVVTMENEAADYLEIESE